MTPPDFIQRRLEPGRGLKCSPFLDRPAGRHPFLASQSGPCAADRFTSGVGGLLPIAKAAAWLGCCRSTLTGRIKLSYLAPDIVEAILAGRQPRSLTRRWLATIDLPIDWRLQRKMLGFD